LKSSRRIGMAMGILMAQFRIRQEEAFDMLRDASQTQNRKLRDLAEDVILIGTLEPGGLDPG
jgi:AmiR/NasT family two-component response regulator